jgi:hypothetical protein
MQLGCALAFIAAAWWDLGIAHTVSKDCIMKMIFPLLLLCATSALAWETPARGSADRKGLMDALRPQAEKALGAPVEFVIEQARVAGNVAFVMASPQRPGGKEINLDATPMAQRGEYYPDMMDGGNIDALLQKSGKTWVAMQFTIGATDAWWSDPAFCATYMAVIPEVCP